MVSDSFGLDIRPLDGFNLYWLEKIIGSDGFRKLEPDEEQDSWYLSNKTFGWLTQRHGGALRRHGYTYKFAFWEQPVGEARGHLWIQTDKGPLVLSDATDAVSLRSYFPVQVSSLDGRPMFELREEDVPEALWRSGPDVPKELSARA